LGYIATEPRHAEKPNKPSNPKKDAKGQFEGRRVKWRAVIDIDIAKGVPSGASIASNMHALARYAALCQEAGIVPIVEPEVMMEGNHGIDTCYEVSKAALLKLYGELYGLRVKLEGTILKPNMVISGKKSATQAGTEEIAEKTIKLFREAVPAAVPGIGHEDTKGAARPPGSRAEGLGGRACCSLGMGNAIIIPPTGRLSNQISNDQTAVATTVIVAAITAIPMGYRSQG
jgi:hypothetical protein